MEDPLIMELHHFKDLDCIAEVELETNQEVHIYSDLEMYIKRTFNEDRIQLERELSKRSQAVKRSRSQERREMIEEMEREKIRKEAMSDVVKVRRTYDSSPEEIRLRQEIRSRRDHVRDWVRRWQDKTCKYRNINLINMMNINKVDQDQERMDDMMKDVMAMKKRFEEKLKEREVMIKSGVLDANVRTGPLGLEKAEKMVNWMRKVKEVSDLAETEGLDLEEKTRRFHTAIVRMAARARGVELPNGVAPLVQ